MKQEQNDYYAKKVREQLAQLSLRDQVEVLANVIMYLGVTHMVTPDRVTPSNIAELVLQDRKSNGETVPNALALQGLTMLMWLKDSN